MSTDRGSHDGTPPDRARSEEGRRRRRRRRRRGGDASAASGSPAPGRAEATPGSGAARDVEAGGDRGASADPGADSSADPGADSRADPGAEPGPRGSETRRRRRRRRRDGGARPEQAPRPPVDQDRAADGATDPGPDEPRQGESSGERTPRRARERDRGRERALDEPREEAWGDDSAAPTTEVALAADLPADPPPDELDPVTAALDDEASAPSAPAGPVRNVVGIKFTTAGKIYLFDAGDDLYQVGEEVVVETERGPGVGRVAVAPLRQEVTRSGPLRRVLRRPGRSDQRRLEANRERAEAALRAAKTCARELGLAIKIFRAELSMGGGKALVYFSSDEKVDVRRLMRELSQRLHVRVELRQTGVRDEAKMVGGIGSCGQELCCTTWLPAFVPVSIKNAKDQGLVLNPTKVSGQCGRLKCCLVYEQATYAELRRGLPKLGKRVITGSGEGRVIEVDVLRQRVRVSLVGGEVEIFEARDVRPMFPSQPGARPQDPP
jgi:cell fate regulator YaaT (PSP1 superfamily)